MDKEGKQTYRKGAQLSRAALLPDSSNLGNLARNTEYARASLQVAQGLHIQQAVAEQRDDADSQGRHEQSRHSCAATVVQNQHGDDDILAQDQGRLAVGAERKLIAHVVGQRDEVGRCLEQVREERDARRRLGLQEFDNLGDLDN